MSQALKEMAARQHAFAKETLERKFKNRKIEYDEGTMMRLIKRLGFKIVTDFYQAIADEELDVKAPNRTAMTGLVKFFFIVIN
jgi:GTP pyrophosphokinase